MKRVLIIVLSLLMVLSLAGCRSSDYKRAVELYNEEDYAEAQTIFDSLQNYKDSEEYSKKCNDELLYAAAIELQGDFDYIGAADIYKVIPGVRDSDERLAFCNSMLEALEAFNESVKSLNDKNNEFQKAISSAVELASSPNKALDENSRNELIEKISSAKEAIITIPKDVETIEELNSAAKALLAVDYTEQMASLSEAKDALQRSLHQYALVNNPAEEDVIARLKTVSGILAIEAATEDNDPNGMLHKPGSYTAAIYFQYDKVSDEYVLKVIRDYGVIEAGTEAGGQIEVYASEADAIQRNTYLSTFDGTFIASGSHTVIGTCVVRTSNVLTASQQKGLETKLIEALIKID